PARMSSAPSLGPRGVPRVHEGVHGVGGAAPAAEQDRMRGRANGAPKDVVERFHDPELEVERSAMAGAGDRCLHQLLHRDVAREAPSMPRSSAASQPASKRQSSSTSATISPSVRAMPVFRPELMPGGPSRGT